MSYEVSKISKILIFITFFTLNNIEFMKTQSLIKIEKQLKHNRKSLKEGSMQG